MLWDNFHTLSYYIFISVSWITIGYYTGFYDVYRYTKVIQIFGKVVKQYFLFLIVNFAYIGYFLKFSNPSQVISFITASLLIITAAKLSIFYALRKFRVVFGGNFRRVVLVGKGKSATQLIDFFNENPDYGYKLEKVYNMNSHNEIDECFTFVIQNRIDEIYCCLSNLNTHDINRFIDFTDNNLKILKFLPDNKEVLARSYVYDYYGYIPVISLRNIPLDNIISKK